MKVAEWEKTFTAKKQKHEDCPFQKALLFKRSNQSTISFDKSLASKSKTKNTHKRQSPLSSYRR